MHTSNSSIFESWLNCLDVILVTHVKVCRYFWAALGRYPITMKIIIYTSVTLALILVSGTWLIYIRTIRSGKYSDAWPARHTAMPFVWHTRRSQCVFVFAWPAGVSSQISTPGDRLAIFWKPGLDGNQMPNSKRFKISLLH